MRLCVCVCRTVVVSVRERCFYCPGPVRMSRASCRPRARASVALRCAAVRLGLGHSPGCNKDYILARNTHTHALTCPCNYWHSYACAPGDEDAPTRASSATKGGMIFMIFQKIDIYCLICYVIYILRRRYSAESHSSSPFAVAVE